MNWRELFDYPVSHDYYRALCVDHGEPDPGPCEAPEGEPVVIPQEINDRMDRLQGEVVYLKDQLKELRERKAVRNERY
ncbi:MAG: hypothetical protein PHV11_06805 [Candidatus Bipolaricaulis sp.]|nr:hypothetical protein [Candidatus Bipolaricaulis sp.]